MSNLFRPGLVLIVVVLMLAAAPEVRAQTFRLTLRTLYGEKTTEQGHDEIFAIVTGRNGDGSTFRKVLPSGDGDADNNTAWDLNDSGDKQDRWLRYPLHMAPLLPGQWTEIRVVFIESDGGDYNTTVAAVGDAMSTSGNPWVAVPGLLASAAGHLRLVPANGNDALGGIVIMARNNNGRLEWLHEATSGDTRVDTHAEAGLNAGGVANQLFARLRNLDGGDGNYHSYYYIHLLP